ncbi:MAG: FkbM family methyltransferase [Acidobacteria bacterium]|nr:FkbM family methyltransferase [Acidobacteriota bacterium]
MVSSRAEGPCPVLWDTLLGSFWGRDSDAPVLYSTIEQMVIQRERETPQVVVQPGDVVLDVGSHLGTFTRYALRRGARLVVAFEPEPINVTCFKKNFPTELEQGQVILIEAAAWEASGILELASGSDNLSWTFSAVSERQSENSAKLSIKAVTIDDIVEQQELSSIDFIKMNIEGAERYALRGARRTIGRFAPRMDISTHHLPDDPRTIPQLVFEIRPAYRVSFNNRLSEAFFH